MTKNIHISGRRIVSMEVQPEPCNACPFEGKNPVPLTCVEKEKVFSDAVNLRGQHLCHTAGDKKICRGGRNLLLATLVKRGFIESPTDEAFAARSRELLGDDLAYKPSQRRKAKAG